MARNERSPEQFEIAAKELADASASMSAMATMIREGGMPSALVHGSTTLDRYLPAILDWIDRTSGEVKAQVRAYRAGTASNAEIQKQRSDTRKATVAKKPFAPKAAKKKAT